MKVIRSCFFYISLFISTILLGTAATLTVHLSGRSDWAHLIARLWGALNLRTAGVEVRVEGIENIDPKSAYVYTANHQSWFDIFAILGKLPVQFRWLAKEELFRLFALGRAMKAAGYIPIDRSDHRKAFESMNQAAARVKSGTSIVIFPEGTRSMDGILQDFKKGGFILAVKSQQPIVPISISGSHRVLPKKGDWMIHPGVVRMTVGKPISTEGCTTRDIDALKERVREAIQEHLTRKEGGPLPDREAAQG